MDAAQKTEKIAAPDGKHDDYCDSTVIALHAALGMLPPESSFSSVSLNTPTRNVTGKSTSRSKMGLFAKTARRTRINKHAPGGI